MQAGKTSIHLEMVPGEGLEPGSGTTVIPRAPDLPNRSLPNFLNVDDKN